MTLHETNTGDLEVQVSKLLFSFFWQKKNSQLPTEESLLVEVLRREGMVQEGCVELLEGSSVDWNKITHKYNYQLSE